MEHHRPGVSRTRLHPNLAAVESARNRGPRRPPGGTSMVKDSVDDIEEPVDDEAPEDDLEDVEPSEADLAEATVPPEPAAGADVESIQDLLVKQEATEEEAEEEEEEASLALTREERL